MKSVSKLFALGAMCLSVFASCEDDAGLEQAIPGDKLSLNAYLLTVGDQMKNTKSPISSWTSTDQLGVFVKQGDVSSADYGAVSGQVKATYGALSWTLDQEVKLSKQTAYVYAYYPYSATVADPTAIPIEMASQTDFLYAGSGRVASSSSSNVTLPMAHALTLFSFNIRKQVGDDCTLNSVQIKSSTGSNVVISEGTLNCATGAITPTAYAPYTFEVNRTIEEGGWTTDLPTALVFPMTVATPSNLEFVFTINQVPYTVKAPAGLDFSRGLKYLLNLNLTGSDLTLDASGITITPWGNGTTVDLDAIELRGPGMAYTITVGSGAQQTVANVGAVQGTLDWGDGTTQNYAVGATHTYADAGTYTVGIDTEDDIPTVNLASVADLDVLDLSKL